MRDQIRTAIAAHLAAAANAEGYYYVSDRGIESLTEAVLASLSQVPDGTPAPQPVAAPAQTVFTIDPAMVVARQARRALDNVLAQPVLTRGDVEALMDGQNFAAEPTAEARETREFLFAIQEMFGCKVRCVRAGEGERRFLVVGNDGQREALIETLDSFKVYAAPLLTDLDTEQRREFWATLGALVASTDDAEALIEDNRDNYADACTMMRDSYGAARTLNRASAATEGRVYDLATSVVANGL